jgi:hypothetical protein
MLSGLARQRERAIDPGKSGFRVSQRSRGYAPAANAEILWEELRREEFDCCHPGLENRIAVDHPGAIHQAPSILDLVRAGRGYAGPVIMITGHLGQYVPNCIFNPIPPGVA